MPDEIRTIVEDCEPRVMVCHASNEENARAGAAHVVERFLVIGRKGADSYDEWLAQAQPLIPPPVDETAIFSIAYSSGAVPASRRAFCFRTARASSPAMPPRRSTARWFVDPHARQHAGVPRRGLSQPAGAVLVRRTGGDPLALHDRGAAVPDPGAPHHGRTWCPRISLRTSRFPLPSGGDGTHRRSAASCPAPRRSRSPSRRRSSRPSARTSCTNVTVRPRRRS